MRSEDYCSWSVCVCVRVSVRLSTVNLGNSERETWAYYQVGGMHGKLRFWSGEGRGSWTAAKVSVRQIEIADDRCLDARCFARVENICWSACIDGLTSIQRKNTAEIIKGEQSLVFSETEQTIEPP